MESLNLPYLSTPLETSLQTRPLLIKMKNSFNKDIQLLLEKISHKNLETNIKHLQEGVDKFFSTKALLNESYLVKRFILKSMKTSSSY